MLRPNIQTGEDGFYYFYPEGMYGYLRAKDLQIVVNYLNQKNLEVQKNNS